MLTAFYVGLVLVGFLIAYDIGKTVGYRKGLEDNDELP